MRFLAILTLKKVQPLERREFCVRAGRSEDGTRGRKNSIVKVFKITFPVNQLIPFRNAQRMVFWASLRRKRPPGYLQVKFSKSRKIRRESSVRTARPRPVHWSFRRKGTGRHSDSVPVFLRQNRRFCRFFDLKLAEIPPERSASGEYAESEMYRILFRRIPNRCGRRRPRVRPERTLCAEVFYA